MGILSVTEADAHAAALADRAPQRAGIEVRLNGVEKSWGARNVLHALDLEIAGGEFVAIIGRSGCGKSTLLRMLAGLETPSAGQLTLAGQPLRSTHEALRFMFQDARLLPWKTVADNVGLGLAGSRAEVRAAACAALAQVGLADRAEEWPARLSGGQRQRVALARALVHRPRLLLLDEPLGALDALTRIEMHELIEKLWLAQGFTAVLVTHDVAEAVALADRVLLIENGRIGHEARITLPRRRARGSASFAAFEDALLQRVLLDADAPALPISAGAQVAALAHRRPCPTANAPAAARASGRAFVHPPSYSEQPS